MLRQFNLLFVLFALIFVSPVYGADELDQLSVTLFKAQVEQANRGRAQDQFFLGDMYEKGTGTAKDLSRARFWYQKAAAQGFKEAQRKLDNWDKARAAERDAKRLTEQARREAKQRQQAQKAADKNRQGRAKKAAKKPAKKAPAPKPVAAKADNDKVAESDNKKAKQKGSKGFKSDPCSGPTAKFVSTCRGKK